MVLDFRRWILEFLLIFSKGFNLCNGERVVFLINSVRRIGALYVKELSRIYFYIKYKIYFK